MLDLLQYLTITGPIHLHTIKAGLFDWMVGRIRGGEMKQRRRPGTGTGKDAIVKQSALFANLLSRFYLPPRRDGMFGRKASMRLFLYLKTCDREELNTKSVGRG